MLDEINPPAAFVPYGLEVDGAAYTILEPSQADAYRVRDPLGQVLGLACADSSVVLSPEALSALLAAPQPAAVSVPLSVRAAALRYVLNGAGLRTAVEGAIAKAGQNAQDSWEYETNIRRDHPLVTGLSSSLGLSESDVDALFVEAAKL